MITLQLSESEVSILQQVFDRALRHSGMDVFDAVAHFRIKIAQATASTGPPAIEAPSAPVSGGNGARSDAARHRGEI